MRLFQRLTEINVYTALLERALKWGPAAVGFVGASAASAWATFATEILEKYAPLSWTVGAIIGGVLFALGYWLFAKAKEALDRSQFMKEMSSRVSVSINPLDNLFTKHRIDLNVFRRPPPEMVSGKTFVECEMYGPANIILNGYTNLIGGHFAWCDFVMVKVGHPIYNAIALENTTFRDCRVYNVTFLIPEYLAQAFPGSHPGANWITPNSPPS